jgi:alternate signal-mediated exported protein
MKKSTKGALAVGAAAILLMGGGTTLAFWTDQATAEGGTITHGSLAIEPVSCQPTWFHADGGTATTEAVTEVVPGDQIAKTCTFTVDAEGDHLAATVDAPDTLTWTAVGGGALPEGTTFTATVGATYTIGPDATVIADGGTITEANDGQTLTATFLVDIPYGSDTGDAADGAVNENDTMSLAAELDTLTVTLTQTDH